MKKFILLFCSLVSANAWAQETFPVNGSLDKRPGQYAFIHATIVVNADQTITDGVLLIKGAKIEAIGAGVTIPKGYSVIDLKGKWIYPALIDAYSSYGIPALPANARGNGMISEKKGAYSWNEAIHPETTARSMFAVDGKKSEELKKSGFAIVNSIIPDGIARGSSVVVTLRPAQENEVVLKDESAAAYSFAKGSSGTSYPESLMGAIALLRQTNYDAKWYAAQKEIKEFNISLAEFNRQQNLPQLFEAGDWQDVLRADKIGDEFNKQFIFKTGGDDYQRIDLIKATNGSLIVPVNFPKAFDIEDAGDARVLSLSQLKHWEMAPANPAAIERAGIKFALTSYGTESGTFWPNLRAAIDHGLTEKQALKSLTEVPSQLLGIDNLAGTITKGKLANFIITSGNLFTKDNVIFENWIQGNQFVVSKMNVPNIAGSYNLSIDGLSALQLKINSAGEATIQRTGTDSVKAKGNLVRLGDQISIHFNLKKNPAGEVQLSGYMTSSSPLAFKGDSDLPDGTKGKWSASFTNALSEPSKTETKAAITIGKVIYPFMGYGYENAPRAEAILFKNATIWTNEKEGKLLNADVLIEAGKIKAVGKNLASGSAKVIDATGKHISAGVIDEHSHVGFSGNGNEGTQTVTAEVRIADILSPNDINIYRQLSGGVVAAQILHGSANSIGGQAQLIKFRWGRAPEEMKIEGADAFIKFALGENVKQSNWGPPQPFRFPQTRMGTEQVFLDAFIRAKEYKTAWAAYNNAKVKTGLEMPRRDLELDALAEILDNKRFITCHSYVQSEINMLMKLSDSLGFKINSFTHIIEGYKVADKMKARGIAAGTFSDWWGYKHEVAEAIPYNGKILNSVGVVTAFNSDDAEGARHLNQEAGKAVMYGGVSEEDALKLVTLNPAKILHIDHRTGSIKVGKDADLVLWSANPLSIYARAEKTFVDGIAYWDMERDLVTQQEMAKEKSRLVQKMIDAKSKGAKTRPAVAEVIEEHECEKSDAHDNR